MTENFSETPQPPAEQLHGATTASVPPATPQGGGPWPIDWSRPRAALASLSLSRIQTLIGIAVGTITIVGALYSVTQFFKPTHDGGELVALVREDKSDKVVPDATIEVLTPLNALVTTITPDETGRARQRLKEGIYVVRVWHPRYAAEIRQIQVFPGQTVEVKTRLHAGASVPFKQAGEAINGGVRSVRKKLGF